MSAPDFVLLGLPLPDGVDPLATWRVAEHDPVSMAAAQAAEETLMWRIDLPRTDDRATDLLTSKIRDLTQRSEWLGELATQADPIEVLTATDGLSSREDVRRALEILQRSGAQFGGGAELIEDARTLWEQGVSLLRRFRRLIAYAARIDTRIEGREIGLTTVSWTGDFATHWQTGITEDDREAHLEAVHLALKSRLVLIRFVGIVIQGAAELAAKAAVPGAQVLLIPAVYRLLRDLWRAWPNYRAFAARKAEPIFA